MNYRTRTAGMRASLMSTVACAVLMTGMVAASAHAQDATAAAPATDDTTTVVVTGIRKGLQDSISLKRKSTSIIEAVSAEDIGKLPDVSIAESLARLPGLAGQRVNGHAQVISIRGLSPDFSNTLLNGRMQVSTGDNRAAEFDQYPSELVNSAIVYKTPDAGLVGQGLSGTVDLNTIHPLDFKHRVISLGVRGSHNSNGALMADSKADGDRLNFTYVDQFMDGKVGLALGYAHLDDPTQTKHSKSWWWDTLGTDGSGNPRLDAPAAQSGDYFLNGAEVWDDSRSQKRDGYMAIIEFKPNDNFHSVNDLYYSKYDQTDTIRGAMWYQTQWADDIHVTNPTFLTVGGTEIANGGSVAGVVPIIRNDYNSREDTMASIGSKNTWSWGDWKMLADLGYSEAKRNEVISETYAGYGTDPTPITRTTDTVDEHIAYGGFPTLDPSLNYGDASKVLLGDVAPWGGWGHDGTIRYPHVKDTLEQAKFQGSHDLAWGPVDSVDVGAAYSERTKSKTVDEFNLCLKGGTMNPDGTCHGPRVAVDSKYLVDSADLSWAGFGGVLSYDIPAVEAAYYDTQPIADTAHYNKNWKIQEDMTTGYVRFNLHSDLGGIGLRGNFGFQIVGAKQQSDGVVAQCVGSPCVVQQLPAHFQASYTDVLPSMNLIFDLSDKTDIRLAMARQMARPRMDDLRSNVEGGVDITTGVWGGSGGNPLLKPWRANAVDVAVEHYFSKASYIGVAWFRKYLTTYIRTETITDFDFTGYPNPGGHPAVSNIGNFTHPVNGEGGNVEGLEISGAMEGRLVAPWLDGFGVIGSWSRGWTDIAAGDPTDPGKLPGFSGTVTNVTGYYDKHGFSARISERWRSAELGETVQLFANRATTRILPDKQIDAQVSYDFSDAGPLKGLSLVLQAYNLTNSAYQTQLKVTENKTANGGSFPEIYEQYGTTWIFGVNYKFQ